MRDRHTNGQLFHLGGDNRLRRQKTAEFLKLDQAACSDLI